MANVNEIYYKYQELLNQELDSNDYYNHYMNLLIDGKYNAKLIQKAVSREVDMKWVEALENAIIPLDIIIRNPNRFIRNDEEIVPIEMSRNVTIESIKHLAQHTNMIAEVKGDTVTPNKILNVRKEESFETYENRFIYTLVKKIQYFLDKRLQALLDDIKRDDFASVEMSGEFIDGAETFNYDLKINYKTTHLTGLETTDSLLKMDISNLTNMERIQRIRLIIYDFTKSQLFKDISGCSLVKPPLNMTNVLKRNPNFRKAVELWAFIERYEGLGYKVNYINDEKEPTSEYSKELLSMMVLELSALRVHTATDDQKEIIAQKKKEIINNVVKQYIDDVMDKFDLSIDEVRRIYNSNFDYEDNLAKAEFNKVKEIIKRCISLEEEKEKLQIQKEKEEIKIKKEKERLRILKEKEKEKAKKLAIKLKAEEKARLQKEKELAKKQKAKDKLLAKKQKELEQLKKKKVK